MLRLKLYLGIFCIENYYSFVQGTEIKKELSKDSSPGGLVRSCRFHVQNASYWVD